MVITAAQKLTKEYSKLWLNQNPVDLVVAKPSADSILTWYYVIKGPPDTPFEGGEYFGRLVFPARYPFAPPNIRMYTPSGRFEPDQSLCMSVSDWHPEQWNSIWNTITIMVGVLSFFTSNELGAGSITSMRPEGSDANRRALAVRSKAWNRQSAIFCREFPGIDPLAPEEAVEVVAVEVVAVEVVVLDDEPVNTKAKAQEIIIID